MIDLNEAAIQAIELLACRRARALVSANEHVQNATDREAIKAELDFQRWLAATCADCQYKR